jgi:hypothetical protein
LLLVLSFAAVSLFCRNSLIRLSLGIEDASDITADLEQAFEKYSSASYVSLCIE